MHFETGAIQSIKSISQRSLALYWLRLAGDRALPSLSHFRPPERIHDPRQLSVWRIAFENGVRDFRAVYLGENIKEGFGGLLSPGCSMQATLPQKLVEMSLAGANACVQEKCPIYMIISSRSDDGDTVDCERLVLPFGEVSVDAFIASLQLFSINGRFERRSILGQFTDNAEVILALKIAPVR
jgi:hypothetical protein